MSIFTYDLSKSKVSRNGQCTTLTPWSLGQRLNSCSVCPPSLLQSVNFTEQITLHVCCLGSRLREHTVYFSIGNWLIHFCVQRLPICTNVLCLRKTARHTFHMNLFILCAAFIFIVVDIWFLIVFIFSLNI